MGVHQLAEIVSETVLVFEGQPGDHVVCEFMIDSHSEILSIDRLLCVRVIECCYRTRTCIFLFAERREFTDRCSPN